MNIDPRILEAINQPGPVKYEILESDFENGPVPMAFFILTFFGNQSYCEPVASATLAKNADEAAEFLESTTRAMFKVHDAMSLAHRALSLAFMEFILLLGNPEKSMDRFQSLAELAGAGAVMLERGESVFQCPDLWPPETKEKFESYLRADPRERIVAMSKDRGHGGSEL